MELANILLSLGGDHGNTVPKYGITPSEVAVLRVIHGEEAVNDIDPYGHEERTSRAERARLIEVYGKVNTNGQRTAAAVETLFPGVAARVFESFDELELLPQFFISTSRARGATPKVVEEQAKPAAAPKPEKPARKPKKAAAAAPPPPEPEPEIDPLATDDDDEDDGVGDMGPGVLG